MVAIVCLNYLRDEDKKSLDLGIGGQTIGWNKHYLIRNIETVSIGVVMFAATVSI
jgi:hypothetical protein